MRYLILVFLMATAGLAREWENISTQLFDQLPRATEYENVLERRVGALTVMPATGDLFLILNNDAGVFHSGDAGDTWRRTGARMTGRSYGAYSVSLDPLTNRFAIFRIVLETDKTAVNAMTLDNGNTWQSFGKPDHDGWTWGMPNWTAAHPKTILAKEHHAWIIMWLSTDGGRSWTQLDFKSRNPGLLNDSTIIAGNDDGIYRSIDRGQTFAKVSDFVVTGKIPTRYGDNYYWTTADGVIITRDFGNTWELVSSPLPDALYGPFFGHSERQMLVVNNQGFFITRDEGTTWKKVADTFADPDSNNKGQYNVMHPTNSHGWDATRNIIYAAFLGGDAYRLKLD